MNELKVVLSKPYQFEEKEYTEVDLSGIESMTTKDFRDIELAVTAKGQNVVMAERTINGSNAIAARAANLPVEFFEGLPLKDGLRVRDRLAGFLAN